jgi:transposase
MGSSFRISSLVPSGLVVESVIESEEMIKVTARSRASEAQCPSCGSISRQVHSRYIRQVADLPCTGRRIALSLIARRFFCRAENCRRQIFAERFGEAILAGHARRTARLDCIVHYLGLALGGRPAASFARRLMLPVSNDTLLRLVRRRACRGVGPLAIVGIDDFAFRRNHHYGSIVCDLERRRIVALLLDREVATVEAWLAEHREIKILSRDRGGGYGEAAAKALPGIIQVADRWHLMENASAAFLDAVRKSMRAIRIALGATKINPALLTCAEKLQYEGYLRREETNAAILKLAKDGVSIKQIARQLGCSRKLTRQVIRGQRGDVFPEKARWTPICLSSMRNGKTAAEMVPNFGAV